MPRIARAVATAAGLQPNQAINAQAITTLTARLRNQARLRHRRTAGGHWGNTRKDGSIGWVLFAAGGIQCMLFCSMIPECRTRIEQDFRALGKTLRAPFIDRSSEQSASKKGPHDMDTDDAIAVKEKSRRYQWIAKHIPSAVDFILQTMWYMMLSFVGNVLTLQIH